MKFKLAALIFALSVSLCACQSTSNTTVNEQANTAADNSTANNGDTPDNGLSAESGEKVITVKAGKPCKEIQDADIYSGKIQISDKLLTFPMTVREFEQATGVETDTSDDSTDINYSGQTSLYLNDNEDYDVTLYYKNPGTDTISAKDCIIYSVEIFPMTRANDVFLPRGIGSKSTEQDIYDTYGEKAEDTRSDIIYYDDPVTGENNDIYSATGNFVEFSAFSSGIDIYKATFATADPNDTKFHLIDTVYDEDNYEYYAGFEVPYSLTVKEYQHSNNSGYVSGKYSASNVTGDMVIDDATLSYHYSTEEEFMNDFSEPDRNIEKISDNGNLILLYESSNDATDTCLGTFFFYDRSLKLFGINSLEFYPRENLSDEDINDLKAYAAEIINTFKTIKIER